MVIFASLSNFFYEHCVEIFIGRFLKNNYS